MTRPVPFQPRALCFHRRGSGARRKAPARARLLTPVEDTCLQGGRPQRWCLGLSETELAQVEEPISKAEKSSVKHSTGLQ